MTGSDIAMLALTLAGFVLIAMLPYAAFLLVELTEDALLRARDRTTVPAPIPHRVYTARS